MSTAPKKIFCKAAAGREQGNRTGREKGNKTGRAKPGLPRPLTLWLQTQAAEAAAGRAAEAGTEGRGGDERFCRTAPGFLRAPG